MCVYNPKSMMLHRARRAYKIVMVRGGTLWSMTSWSIRTPQRLPASDLDAPQQWVEMSTPGVECEYAPNTEMKDDLGIGFYVYTNRRKTLDLCLGFWFPRAVLEVVVPPQEVLYARDPGGLGIPNAMIAKRIHVKDVIWQSAVWD